MLTPAATYDAMKAAFRWEVPARLNMAAQVCDTWAARAPDRVAIIEWDDTPREVSYGALRRMADALAHHLVAIGAERGDRIGVLRSQSAWTVAAHIAIWKIGAISIPLFKLFGDDALLARLEDAGARLVIGDGAGSDGLLQWGQGAGRQVVVPESIAPDATPFETFDTAAEDAAVLIYTSGTTGAPKGALHAHRVLTGHLPGVEMSHDFLGQPGDCLWTPADWAWIGGLFDVALPGLALGVSVVAARMAKFDVDRCCEIIAAARVRNVFFPPTALRMLRAADAQIPGLRSVASGGEPLGGEMLRWGQAAFGLNINEFYGQTECNMVASSAASLFAPRPGCIGKPVPGFELAVLDTEGRPTGGEGDIAVRNGAVSMMLGYWQRPQETADKMRGDWMLTGDRGLWDGDYLRFLGRQDDVITSSGYRIGPSEIEDCLLRHASVATVGVVGKPDALRTEIVKAFVVLRDGVAPGEELIAELQDFVRQHVAQHAYPREVEFLEALPMTVTGKVIRKALRQRTT